jgi:hypothetical protein
MMGICRKLKKVIGLTTLAAAAGLIAKKVLGSKQTEAKATKGSKSPAKKSGSRKKKAQTNT